MTNDPLRNAWHWTEVAALAVLGSMVGVVVIIVGYTTWVQIIRK